jgi:hypothetical protein
MRPTPAKAQSTADLIQQLVLDAEKLSTLKSTLNEMVQAYDIIDKGYSNIRDIVKGNFNLHKAFLDAMLAVSPTVQGYPGIADIFQSVSTLAMEYRTVTAGLAKSPFTLAEIDYIIGVYTTLLQRSNNALDELTMILTDGELRMPDDQRMQAIDRIGAEVNNELSAFHDFSSVVSLQAAQRSKERNELNTLKWMYGLPQ